VQPVEIEVSGGRSQHDLSVEPTACTLADATPYPVNLFVMNPLDLAAVAKGQPRAIQLEGRVNICLPFWELPRLPPDWVRILECLDIAAAASQFIRYTMLADLSGPSVPYWPQPIYLPENIVPDRTRWGIPRDSVMFVSAFEMASDTNRKNPLGAIEAFNRAFTQQDDAYLVVKANNARAFPAEGPYRQLQEYVARNSKIVLLDEVLTYRDVLSLYASADAFLSLHRAEGLGLCLLEAMSLGKPVIATGWSGNMDFTTDQNSCLVGYSLVKVQASTQAAYSVEKIGNDARWAEPNLDEAVVWLRRLAESSDLRERIGKQAALDVAARQSRMGVAELTAAVETVRGIRRRRPS
jgi:glycosyltransferase involved in cell wall biosynthesis